MEGIPTYAINIETNENKIDALEAFICHISTSIVNDTVTYIADEITSSILAV